MRFRPSFAILLVLLVIGCGSRPAEPTPPTPGARADAEKVRAADYSILFVGNSHTSSHDVPNLVAKMIEFQQPRKSVYTRTITVGHLEDLARDSRGSDELEAAPWKFVVLQAQKISISGKFEYPRTDGIEFAKRAKSRGASVYFYSEWGLKDVPGDGERNEKIYREMARDSGAGVLPVGRAWDFALFVRPELPLHAFDGNHQAELGAFVTACVIASRLTGESATKLAAFPYPHGTNSDRKFLAAAAAEGLAQYRGEKK